MTTNKQDEKSLEDDQGFIQSLYDDLCVNNSDTATQAVIEHPTDQPSDQLDQRILEAAHKAVEVPSQLIDFSIQQTSNDVTSSQHLTNNIDPVVKRKKIAWYYPMATAASFLLVLTIVNHQLNGPINPIYEEQLVSMDKKSISQQSEPLNESDEISLDSALLEEAVFENELSLVASTEVPNLFNKKIIKSHRLKEQLKAKMENPPITSANPQLMESDFIDAASDKRPSFIEKQDTKSEMLASNNLTSTIQRKMIIEQPQIKHSFPANDTQKVVVKNSLLNKSKLNASLSVITLSHEKYKELQVQSIQKDLYWLLEQEDNNSYLIELLTPEQSSVFYRLNKNSFQLNKSNESTKQTFAEIIYIKDK
jgi:hypothetical protein